MARLSVDKVLDFGLVEGHLTTDWIVQAPEIIAENGEPTVVFKSIDDPVNLMNITATLRNPDGTFYDPYLGTIAKCRLNYGTFKTMWFNLPPCEIKFLPANLPYKLQEPNPGSTLNSFIPEFIISVSATELTLNEGATGEVIIENFDEFLYPVILISDHDSIIAINKDKILVTAPPLEDDETVKTIYINIRLGYSEKGILHIYEGINLVLNIVQTIDSLSIIDTNLDNNYVGSQVLISETIEPESFDTLTNIEIIE